MVINKTNTNPDADTRYVLYEKDKKSILRQRINKIVYYRYNYRNKYYPFILSQIWHYKDSNGEEDGYVELRNIDDLNSQLLISIRNLHRILLSEPK
jgi:hypothetical protein